MKTYNGKNINKKQIREVLRSMDRTKIFQLVQLIKGGKVERREVFEFIKFFAPTNKVYTSAYEIAYLRPNKIPTYDVRNAWSFNRDNAKHLAIEYLKEQIQDTKSPYAKRPMLGHTHLYFCSPLYGHQDYNKWSAMPIYGNEHFCDVLIKLADKYFN